MSEIGLHRRQEPTVWRTLTNFVDTSVLSIEEVSPEVIEHVYKTTVNLDKYELDACRYQAFGLQLGRFGRSLLEVDSNPSARAELVTDGQRHITEDRLKWEDNKRIYIPNAPFVSVFNDATEHTPVAEMVVGNCVETISADRGILAHVHSANTVKAVAQEVPPTLISRTKDAESVVRSAAAQDLIAGLRDINEIRTAHRRAFSSSYEKANQVALSDSAKRFLKGLCAIALEDFRGARPIDERMHFNQDGTIVESCDWRSLRGLGSTKDASIDKDPYFHRSESLVCPAATVPKLIDTMFGLIVDMNAQTSGCAKA